jgi:aspartyl-tRNA(Asn)/glutamyl-tRNA(Gln) amidotransferase subunit A
MVSRYGCVAFASALDQVGPLAQSAVDCGYLLSAIAGKDEYDQTSINSPSFSPIGEHSSVKGKRLAIISELTRSNADPETLAAVKRAAEWFEDAGATVEEISLPTLKYAVPAYYLISSAEASANLSRFDGVRYGYRPSNPQSYEELVTKSRGEGFGWEVKRRIMLGCYALCSGYYDDYYKRAVRLAALIRTEYAAAFVKFDALLSPVSPNPAFPIGQAPTDPTILYLADICTVSASLAGLPALSTPCGYTLKGLPIGLMITGNHWKDGDILSMADAFEREFNRKSPPDFSDLTKQKDSKIHRKEESA